MCITRWQQRGQLAANGPNNGLICSVCWGKGLIEAGAAKWNNRFPFILASGLVVFGFGLLLLAQNVGINTSQALTFVGTLLGSITGFYFGGATSRSGTTDKQVVSEKPTGGQQPARN